MMSFLKLVVISLCVCLTSCLLGIIYGFFSAGAFTFVYIFNANFLAGSFLICIALAKMIIPTGLKPDKLTDQTTLNERYFDKRRLTQKKANKFLFSGILVILIAGVVQLLLSLIIQ
jgi:hypothetical protein